MNDFNDILKGTKQIVLADALGVTQQVISKWCRKKSYPTIPMIHKIAKVLDEDPVEIFKSFKVPDEKVSER